MWRPLVLLAAMALGPAAPAGAQGRRLVEGRVTRPGADSAHRPVAVAGQWVVLHRVGSDRSGPLDSTRSGADGRFRMRYTASGAADALYFVSSRYGGIAYFSPPLRADTVRGGDADVIVYDTSPDTTSLHVQGRHFVLSTPRGGVREVAEIYELDNDGSHTVVARDSVTPLFSAPVPAAAESVTVAQGDIGAGAVAFRPGRAEVFAPISPGVRQLVISYVLPASAFPLSTPVDRAVAVLEVLLEEPRATVQGARLGEVAAASIDGRPFRRFLARDVPRNAVIHVEVPEVGGRHADALRVVALVIALAMAGALVFLLRGRRGPRVAPRRAGVAAGAAPASSETDRLVAALATLDARFERQRSPDGAARAEYERERARLKDALTRALAGETTST